LHWLREIAEGSPYRYMQQRLANAFADSQLGDVVAKGRCAFRLTVEPRYRMGEFDRAAFLW